MGRFYLPILVMHIFCAYHAYKSRVEIYWYFLIWFFPLFGCLIYLYWNIFRHVNIAEVTESFQESVDDNYRLEKLKGDLAFADTAENRMILADEYFNLGNYEEAIFHYKQINTGVYKGDIDLMKKIIACHFQLEQYADVIIIGQDLSGDLNFKNSVERALYAWALQFKNKTASAQREFEEMDGAYSNYEQRIEYTKFLLEIGDRSEAKEKADLLIDELKSMGRSEKFHNKRHLNEIKQIRMSIK